MLLCQPAYSWYPGRVMGRNAWLYNRPLSGKKTWGQALTNNIDRPTNHSLPLAKLTNLSSEWKGGGGEFVDFRQFRQSIILPVLLTRSYMRMCNAESLKRSTKGSNFKEDGRALPL